MQNFLKFLLLFLLVITSCENTEEHQPSGTIDISNTETFINYLIPIKILHSLLLIYLFHTKSHLSLKFFIVSNMTLVIASYLFFGIPIDVFYIIPYLIFNFIYYNKRKKVFIH